MSQEGEESAFRVVKNTYSKDFPKARTGPSGISEVVLKMSDKYVQDTRVKNSHSKDFQGWCRTWWDEQCGDR